MSGPPIEHVVVLMMENRSFDHMLGLLEHPKLPKVTDEPLPNPLDPADPAGPSFTAFELDGHQSLSADPKHGYPDVMRQLTAKPPPWDPADDLTNTGFAWNYHQRRAASGGEVLGCYSEQLLPVLSMLAKEYAVCSRWFCSVPSETWPNRLFAHAATSDNLVENDERLYSNKTVFELLSKAEKSWQVFAGDIPQVAVFSELLWHDGGPRFSRLSAFFERAKKGKLPNYSFLEPRHFGSGCESQHPLSKVLLGERLIAEVYRAVTAKREAWEKTLLLITYDEHGGFFDRVRPEPALPPEQGKSDPKHGFAFDLLGPRVPTVVVSPWIEPETVDGEIHDHTSIIATLRERFGFEATLTARDEAAVGVSHILTATKARPAAPLPELPPTRAADLGPSEWAEALAPDGTIVLNDFQEQLVRLALRVEKEAPPPPGVRGVPIESAVEPPFRSEAEIGEFIEAFRRRRMDPA
jgi:phospholipase C